MASHSETQTSPYTPSQLFAMVADVERYPEFLPWCRAARILERKEGEMLAELAISFNHLTERYTSRVLLYPPGDGPGVIDVVMVKGPFEYLKNHWEFIPLPDGKTQIEFVIEFKFRSRILEKLIGSVFSNAIVKMAQAFRQRADALYGKQAT